MKVLVMDGNLKAALAAVRSLGRRGAEVHTTQTTPGRTLCSLSAFTRRTHVLPSAGHGPAFDDGVLDLLRRERFDYVLPAGEATVRRLARLRESVEALTRIDLPPSESLELVLSKAGLLDFASGVGISIPRTVIADGPGSWVEAEGLTFPVVAKTNVGGPFDRVAYLNTPADLAAYRARLAPGVVPLVQEYIRGTGYGVFALCEHGRPVMHHVHRRIWEYPVTGGPSVCAETVSDPALAALGLRLLEALKWHGVAMVEFKRSAEDGQYRLMEINPRLWGSLDLSIAAGLDFPYAAALADRAPYVTSCRMRPTRFLWVVPDALLFLVARPAALPAALRMLCSPGVRTNIVRDDLRPVAFQLRLTMHWIRVLLPQRRLRRPHGVPGQGRA